MLILPGVTELATAIGPVLFPPFQGSFGRVYLGKWRETTVAIKLLSQPLMPGHMRTGEDAALGPSLQRSKCVLDALPSQHHAYDGAVGWLAEGRP